MRVVCLKREDMVRQQGITATGVVWMNHVDKRGDGHAENKCTRCQSETNEYHEGRMVSNADTIVDPWAVMVVPFNALVADATVTRSRGSNDLAVWTELYRVNKLQ